MPYDTEEVIRGVAKSKNVPFTKYEAVVLLNSYLQYVNGEMTRSEAIADCSGKLRQMAVSSGLTIDDSYRSRSGIASQMISMESAWSGKSLYTKPTRLFIDTVNLYKNNPTEYKKVLAEVASLIKDIDDESAEKWAEEEDKSREPSVLVRALAEPSIVSMDFSKGKATQEGVSCPLPDDSPRREEFFTFLKENLSVRAVHGIKASRQVTDVKTFLVMEEEDWYRVRNLGRKTVKEIMAFQERLRQNATAMLAAWREGKSYQSGMDAASETRFPDIRRDELLSLLQANLSVRAFNGIVRSQQMKKRIVDLASFLGVRESDWRSVRNLGEKSVREIIRLQGELLERYGSRAVIDVEGQSGRTGLYSQLIADVLSFQEKHGGARNELCVALLEVLRQGKEQLAPFGDTAEKITASEPFLRAIGDSECMAEAVRQAICAVTDRAWPCPYDEIEQEIGAQLPWGLAGYLPLGATLRDLTEEGFVEKDNMGYVKMRETFREYIAHTKDLTERERLVLARRSGNATLEEVGRELAVTRERVRQIEAKAIRTIRRKGHALYEDRFCEVFYEYSFSPDEMRNAFGVDATGYYYLAHRYGGSRKKSPADSLRDENIPLGYRKKIAILLKKAAYADCVNVDGTYLPINRQSFLNYFLSHYCEEDIGIEDFYKKYAVFLFMLDCDKDERVTLTARYGEVALSRSPCTLWKQGKIFRFYDTRDVDAKVLLRDFHFEELAGRDVEIGTQYFLDRYPDVAEEYGLKDAYELHNLLKKIVSHAAAREMRMSVCRMPILAFGNANRERQVLGALRELGEATKEEFASYYGEQYGIPKSTFFANYACFAKKYLQGDTYSIAVQKASEEDLKNLSMALTQPYYSLLMAKEIFNAVCPDSPDILNRYNLDKLGYVANDQTIYKKDFSSFREAFIYTANKRGIIEFTEADTNIRTWWIWPMQQKLQAIEFAPNHFIMLSRLEKEGWTKERLVSVAYEVKAAMEESYFTISYFRAKGGKTSVDCLGFDDYFLMSILRFSGAFQSLRHGNTRLFYSGADTISMEGFIADVMEHEVSIDIDDFMDMLREEYGMEYKDNHVVIEIAAERENDLYYNSIMHKLYRDYDAYFQEV